jgi:hypothetical protein
MGSMKGAKLFTLVIILASLVSVGVAFDKFYIARDYFIFANVSCDSTLHSCFVGDGDSAPKHYEKVSRKANTIPTCNGWADQCPELTCAQNDSSCTVEYCQLDTGDTCYGPVPAGQ